MLPKRSRLTKEMIESHLIKARRITTSRFLVMIARVPTGGGPRISITVSKKVAHSAVLRNRLRRRAYEATRPLLAKLSPTTFVLISYRQADTSVPLSVPLSEITKELEKVLI